MHKPIDKLITHIVRFAFISLTIFALFLLPPVVSAASTISTRSPSLDAMLIIPSLDIQAPVIQLPIVNGHWDTSGLTANNVGHLELTSWVGASSNIVLGGHSELSVGAHDGVFTALTELSVGDELLIHENGIVWTYRVTDMHYVSYRDVHIVYPAASETLTLFTCALGTWDSSVGDYSKRYVVTAELIDSSSQTTDTHIGDRSL